MSLLRKRFVQFNKKPIGDEGMTSRRSILLGMALGAFLGLATLNTAYAQVPRSISYQGLLMKDGKPVDGKADLKINIYDAAGHTLYTESYNQVQLNQGVFNVQLGTANPLPGSLKFDQQYFMGVEIDNSGEISPRTPFTAAPYALNAQTVGGVGVSATPQAGMLLPLDQNGKIPVSALPAATQAVDNVNGLTGAITVGSLDGTVKVITNNSTNNIDLSVAGMGGGGLTAVKAGAGLTGGGDTTNGNTVVTLSIAQNGITPGMLGNGSVLGRSLDQNIPALGLYADALGDINVGVNSTLTYSASGTGYITSNGVQHNIGINLANANTWTALQTFAGGATVIGTTTLTGPVNITGNMSETGNFTLTGNETISGTLSVGGTSTFNGIVNTGTLDQQGNIFNSSATNGGAVTVNDPQGLTNAAGNITNTLGNIVNTSGNINNLNGNINNTGQINNTGALNETGVSTLNGNLVQGNGTGTTATFQNNSATFTLTNSGTNGNSVFIDGTAEPNAASAAAVANYELNLRNADLKVVGATNLVGNTYLGQTLTVTGLTTTNGGLTDNGTFTQNGASNFTGAISQTGGTVTLGGATTINNTLNVTGLSTLTGITNNGTLTQNGVITQTSLGASTNNTFLTSTFNGNVQVNGNLSNTGNATLGTNAGTNNTLGNAGSSNNTITGLNNSMIATNTNTITGLTNNINGTTNVVGNTNITGNTAITGTLSNTGNANIATNPGTNNNFGGAGSTNRFNGTSNFGSQPASNGNKLIVDGAANLAAPAGPSGIPPGFVIPTDFEAIVNGDLQVTGWSSLHNATVDNLWITSSLVLPPSASFCANTIQVNTLSSWCGGPVGAPIGVTTALNQSSLGTSTNNSFLASNFNGNVNVTGNTAITGTLSATGNTSVATTSGSFAAGNAASNNTVTGASNTISASGTNSMTAATNTITGTTANNIGGGSTTITSGSFNTANGVVSTFGNGGVTNNGTLVQQGASTFNNTITQPAGSGNVQLNGSAGGTNIFGSQANQQNNYSTGANSTANLGNASGAIVNIATSAVGTTTTNVGNLTTGTTVNVNGLTTVTYTGNQTYLRVAGGAPSCAGAFPLSNESELLVNGDGYFDGTMAACRLNIFGAGPSCIANLAVSNLTACVTPNIQLGSSIIGVGVVNITAINNLQANNNVTANVNMTIGTGAGATNIASSTGAGPINVTTPSVAGRMPTYQTYTLALVPGAGPNGGGAVTFNAGNTGGLINFDANDAIMVTYRSAAGGAPQGALTVTSVPGVSVTVESTAALDNHLVQITILRD